MGPSNFDTVTIVAREATPTGWARSAADAELEREACDVGRGLARREVPALDLSHDTAFDARIAQRRPRERGARHAAAGIDRPHHGHAALQGRVALGLALVASAHGPEVRHDDATDLVLRQAALRGAL